MESREVALARELWELEQRFQTLKQEEKALDERYDKVTQALMDELVQQGKTGTGHIEGVGVFTLRRENHPAVNKADMPVFLGYLRKSGDGSLIEETVHPQTLKSYCKQKLEALAERFAEDDDAAAEAMAYIKATEDFLPPAELAKRYMGEFGVKTFQKMTLAHSKKGK